MVLPLVSACVLVLLVCAGNAGNVAAQGSKPPITLKGLLDALDTHGLSNDELAQIVKSRGVDFQLTPKAESELRAAGADAALLAAVRSSYRGDSAGPNEQPPPSQPRGTGVSAGELAAVQALLDQKKYEEARLAFDALSNPAKASYDGQLLLCKIEQERKQYRASMQACVAATQSRPNEAAPYSLNALSLLMLGETEQAEGPAAKAATLSNDVYYKKLLAIIHYAEEKYDLVAKELPADSSETFVLTLQAGAAFHNRDFDTFRRLRTKLTTLKGNDNGWNLYYEGIAAQQELNWTVALEKYKKCIADTDFMDPVCQIAAASAELTTADYSAAKADIDKVLSDYPKNADAVMQGVFISLKVGDLAEAERLHNVMNTIKPANAEFMDCLYYYGRNQPLLATNHCQAAIKGNENSNGAWSNAGYAALDNADFPDAVSYFSKAWQLFYASKQKHTVVEELDLWWGTMTAEYYSGDKKAAKELYKTLKKTYPEFSTTISLKQLPLLWSDNTEKLMDKAAADLQ